VKEKTAVTVAVIAGAIWALIIIAAISVFLWLWFSRDHVADGHPNEVVGSWEAQYLGGTLLLILHADGSSEQQMIDYPSLPPATQYGTWIVKDERLVITPFLDYSLVYRGFELKSYSSFGVHRTLIGEGVFIDAVDWSFRRVEE
jgi:hypothetical protein